MHSRPVYPTLLLGLAALLLAATAAALEPHAGMLRNPDVSATHIVFRYANDLWLVPRAGGTATPLAGPPGAESFPKFSPDGSVIAFVGNYDGNRDIYTLPVTGGTPFRVTHHPTTEVVSDWMPDGRIIFSAWGMGANPNAMELRTVPPSGGLSELLPVPYGMHGAVSADGRWLAYTPDANDWSTWKRYRGGRASDIWLFDLTHLVSRRITDWEGTDSFPMWQGSRVYYLSDAGPEHRLNVWAYDTTTGERRQVTTYDDYDVKWPSVGPGDRGHGEVVFQHGPELCLLDLATEETRVVPVTIPGDRPKLREQLEDASATKGWRDISPTGKRAIVEARGDVWTLPAKKGVPTNLTRTSGAAERHPTWSPDGQWVAYFSDSSGEYQLWITESDGLGETRMLTELAPGFYYYPTWSPDSKSIAFWDKSGGLYVVDAKSGRTKLADKLAGADPVSLSWSSDSRWLAYWRPEKSLRGRPAIWLYDASEDEVHQVTSGTYADSWPTFDREGKYLYFTSTREYSAPLYADEGNSWIYSQTERLYAVPLTEDTPTPVPPEIDEETWGDDAKDEEKADGDKDAKEGEDEKKDGEEEDEKKPEPVKIDLEGFERRAVALPVGKGAFSGLCVNDEGKLVYMRHPTWSWGGDAKSSIKLLDLDEDEEREKTVLGEAEQLEMSSDGTKLLVSAEAGMSIIEAKPDQTMEDMVSTGGMTVEVNPREEWAQVLRDAWRIERDFFYDPGMHGVDWPGVYGKYAAMLPDCASREDVGYVIGEMIGELNVGHAYYWDEGEPTPSVSVGMPGCDFALENGAYRMSRVVEADPWDVDGRGPLSQPGTDVKVGDYLLAVNGVPLDPAKDPWAAFQGLAGATVTLTVSEKPKLNDDAREVPVELLSGEGDLRYRAWVSANRAYVAARSQGRVGYIHVPDTGVSGQNELVRQFFSQLTKDALIVDERWNGGGQIPTRFIELLNRPATNYWIVRETDEVVPWPQDSHQGPKCMLINGSAGSGGDHFPYLFRLMGLGKLIGTRTWGGLVGLGGNPGLIDGAALTVPSFAFVDLDGTWGIEGHGVDPDIEVLDDPALMVGGKDPQLDAAIDLMLKEIAERPYSPPSKPGYPDRSGMGILPQDR